MRTYLLILLFPLLVSCVSYHKEYEQAYLGYRTPYNVYNSPLRIRQLNYQDFYMMDNHPKDYFKTQMWSGVNSFSQFAIHSFFRNLVR